MIGGLSPEARALLRAAKSDSLPSTARAAIWHGVEQAAVPLVPTAAPPLPVAAAVAPAVTMKAAFVGAILGSVLSAGITLALLSPVHTRATEAEHLVAAPPAAAPVLAQPVSPVSPATTPELAAAPAGDPIAPKAASVAHSEKAHVASGQDSLSREVALVAEARGELLRGDASRALATIRVARSLKVRQLEPEELALEVRALRALDRTEEADRVDAKLRADFPEHALAR